MKALCGVGEDTIEEAGRKYIINGTEPEIGSTAINPESFDLYKKYASLPRWGIVLKVKLKSRS